MSPDDVVTMAVNLTLKAIETTPSFSVANDTYHDGSTQFLDAMYKKILELANKHGQP